MAQTALDVCNLAITRISGERIDALDEETPLGSTCLVTYPQLKATLLGSHRWVFAASRKALVRRLVTPADCPATYAFDPPSDIVGAVFAYRAALTEEPPRTAAEFINGYIATQSPTLVVEYTRSRDEADWPVWFTQLVRIALASELAASVKNQRLAAELKDAAYGPRYDVGEPGGLLLHAMTQDARLAPQRQLGGWDPGALVMARYEGLGGPDFSQPSTLVFLPPP